MMIESYYGEAVGIACYLESFFLHESQTLNLAQILHNLLEML
jgi:hypothetical protein